MDLIEKKIQTSDIDYHNIKDFMKRVFPKEELFPMWLLMLLGKSKRCCFHSFYKDELFIGIVYTIEFQKILHIKYLAVHDTLHSNGYGSEILSIIKNRYGKKTITLFIETLDTSATNYTQRVKRSQFYKKHNFYSSGIKIGNKIPLYELLSTSPEFCAKDCKTLLRFIPMKVFS